MYLWTRFVPHSTAAYSVSALKWTLLICIWNLLKIRGRTNLLNWASFWCCTCKICGQWQPAFQGGGFWWHLGPPALSLQSRSHWAQPFITGLSQRPFKFKKRGRNMESARERERERVQRRGDEECFCCPERLSPVLAMKKCCWWRAQMLKEGIIANKCGQKTSGQCSNCSPAIVCVHYNYVSHRF